MNKRGKEVKRHTSDSLVFVGRRLSDDAAAAGSTSAVLVDGGEGGVLFGDDAAPAGASAAVLVGRGEGGLLGFGRDGFSESVHCVR